MDDSDKLSIEVFGLQCLRTTQPLNEPIYLCSEQQILQRVRDIEQPTGFFSLNPSCGEVVSLMPLPLPV